MGSKITVSIIACAALAAACTPEPEPETEATAPSAPAAPAAPAGESFTAERGGFVPEGVEYDRANGRFLSGSIAEGTIFVLGRDGSVTPFITDAALGASVGIEADEPRDRLLVASSDGAVFQDQTAAGKAFLNAYSLTTGERLAAVDLGATVGATAEPARHFANDVAVDSDGNAYVTDTMMNVIYKVTPDYQASVLHRFTGLEAGAQVNGIEYHPNGYLLAVAGQLVLKVPLADPAAASQVSVAEPGTGQDGIVWAADGTLAVVSNNQQQVVKLRSNDDWATAQRAGVAALAGQATTAAAVGGEIWVVHPHFMDADPPSVEQAVF
jgi:sugar lactone lactonase YvrE